MKILCVNQYYWPDVAATGQLLQDLAEDLSGAGHDVTVLCGQSSYTPGGARTPARETHNGVNIIRCQGTRFGKRHVAGRLADYITFYFSVVWAMFMAPRPDVLFVESTPPLIVVGGALVSKLRRLPLVHIIQDLYPEVAEALGALRPGGILAGVLRRLHRRALRHCSAVVVLGRDMTRRVQDSYGLLPECLKVIPNWADVDALAVSADDVAALRAKWGVQGRKVVMYSGNLGRAHTFDEVLAVAERWKNKKDTIFLCIGAGQAWDQVKKQVLERGLDNVVLKPYQDRTSLGVSLSIGDVHLITQKPETLGLIVPSKLYGVMAVGRPVVYVGPKESEVALTLKDCKAGLTVAPGDVDGLERALAAYLDNPDMASSAGMAGRAYAKREFSRQVVTARYDALFNSIASA
jgi:glycosyltransferase involved in cell wall biosynthesis